jgi:hypothetical protein
MAKKVESKKAEAQEPQAEGNPNTAPSWQSVMDGLHSARNKAEADAAVKRADHYLGIAEKSDPQNRLVKTARAKRDEVFNAYVNT